MKLTLHLTFVGQCEAALTHYQRVLGGTDLRLFKYAGTPMESQVPSGWGDKIVHGSVAVGDVVLAGADVAPDGYQRPQGMFALLTCRDEAEATRVFDALAPGGTIQLPLQKTFWAPLFGAVVDRFGVPWEITCAAE
jgi:PhnB protein